MSLPLVINGTTYNYPQIGDTDWGPDATDWASAVTTGMLQKAGGLFQLLAEVDFGSAHGLTSLYYKSRSADIADTGVLRLARTDLISWRNDANDADLSLAVDSDNNLSYNGAPIGGFTVADTTTIAMNYLASVLSADIKPNSITDSEISGSAGIIYSKLNLSGGIVNSDISASAAIAYSKLNLTAEIVDNDISAAAAISFNKLAALTSGNILVGNGSNVPTSVAMSGDVVISNTGVTTYNGVVPLNKGGTNKNMTAVSGGVVYTDSDSMEVTSAGGSGQLLRSSGSGAPFWSNEQPVTNISSNYNVLTSDKFLIVDCTAGVITLNLYTAFGNNGKQLTFLKSDTSTNFADIEGDLSETINGWASLQLLKQYETVTIVSNGVNWVITDISKNPVVNRYTTGSTTYTTPPGAKYLIVKMVGGGGGGGGSTGNGGSGGSSTFGSSLLTVAGGSGGQAASGGAGLGGVGGAPTINSPAVSIFQVNGGAGGGSPGVNNGYGGSGGNSIFGGGAPMNSVLGSTGGAAAAANSGSGGSGLSGGGAQTPGRGGGAGAGLVAMIPNPGTSYSVAVGAAGSAGTGGNGGGAGGEGEVTVTAYF